MSRATEDMVTGLLAEYLRSKGFNAKTQWSIDLPHGRKGTPDLMLVNEGYFPGEAEWVGQEMFGWSQAQNYLQSPQAAGSFIVFYPKGLKKDVIQARLGKVSPESILSRYKYKVVFLRKDMAPDMNLSVSLDGLQNWLSDNIYRRRGPKTDINEVVSVLRQLVRRFTEEMRKIKDPALFRNILGGSVPKEKEAARQAAAYLLVNQLVFYRVLSHYKEDYDAIDIQLVDSPQKLNEYFAKVLEEDYRPIFSFGVASEFSSLSLLRSAINAIHGISPENLDQDFLGKVFHALIPLEVRKPVAAYYTKGEAAKLLADLSIERGDAKVIDPACGSGTLLVAAYDRKKSLTKAFNEKIHKRFLEQDITGIDVMPFAAHLSIIHLALQAPIYETEKVRIGIEDSTRLRPGTSIHPLSWILPEAKKQRGLDDYVKGKMWWEDVVEKGSVTMNGRPEEKIDFDYQDVVIMNPPFTRHQTMVDFGSNYKDQLETRFKERSELIDKRMKYCYYFLLIADKFLKDGGKIAAVLPTTLLRGDLARKLREMLLKEYRIQYVIVREDMANFSEDTNFREMLFIAEKGEEKGMTSFIFLKRLDSSLAPNIRHMREIINVGEAVETTGFQIRKMPQTALDPNNLFREIAFVDYELLKTWDSLKKNEKLIDLERLNVEIKSRDEPARGGGSFQSLCLNSLSAEELRRDRWIIESIERSKIVARHRYSGNSVEVPRRSVIKGFRRMAYRRTIDVSGLDEYVVIKSFSAGDRFIQLSGRKRVNWKEWRSYVEGRASNLCVAARFDISARGTCLLSYYDNKVRSWSRAATSSICGFGKKEGKIVSLWLNSTINLLQMLAERKETRGAWMEINKFILKEIKIPDPSKLSADRKRGLEQVFEKVSDIEFPSLVEQLAMNCEESLFSSEDRDKILEQFKSVKELFGKKFEPRKIMDKAILDMLGIEAEKQDKLLEKLYPALLKEIAILKGMMQ